MRDQVEEIKAKTDIVSVIGNYINLKKAGNNFKALCPFHSEKTPSFVVSSELQYFKCFGCGEAGDVITFLEKYEGMDFYEALKFLANKAGIELQRQNFRQEGSKEVLYQINAMASRFYQYILQSHKVGKSALEYLINRGLKPETIKTFQIGFSPDAPFAIKAFLVDRKKVSINDLERAGIEV